MQALHEELAQLRASNGAMGSGLDLFTGAGGLLMMSFCFACDVEGCLVLGSVCSLCLFCLTFLTFARNVEVEDKRIRLEKELITLKVCFWFLASAACASRMI